MEIYPLGLGALSDMRAVITMWGIAIWNPNDLYDAYVLFYLQTQSCNNTSRDV